MSEAVANTQAQTTTTEGGAGAGAATSSSNWYDTFKPEVQAYVKEKGFKDPGVLAESYRQLESTIGVPAEHIIRLPKSFDDAEAMGKIYDRLGRPSKAEEYIFDLPKEGVNEEYIKAARGEFHKLGLTKKQAAELVKWNNSFAETSVKAQMEAAKTAFDNESNALKKEWGAAYEQNVSITKTAANKLGISSEQMDALGEVMGYSKAMKFFHTLASKVGEGEFIEGGKGESTLSTPQQAQAKIGMLMKDSDFMTRYSRGEEQAVDMWNKLHAQAYVES